MTPPGTGVLLGTLNVFVIAICMGLTLGGSDRSGVMFFVALVGILPGVVTGAVPRPAGVRAAREPRWVRLPVLLTPALLLVCALAMTFGLFGFATVWGIPTFVTVLILRAVHARARRAGRTACAGAISDAVLMPHARSGSAWRSASRTRSSSDLASPLASRARRTIRPPRWSRCPPACWRARAGLVAFVLRGAPRWLRGIVLIEAALRRRVRARGPLRHDTVRGTRVGPDG